MLLRCPVIKGQDVCTEEQPNESPAGPGKPEGPQSRSGRRQHLPGIQHPHHPQGQAQNLRAPSRIISILLITQACLLKKHSLLSLTGIVPVWSSFLYKYSKSLKWSKVHYNVTKPWLLSYAWGASQIKVGKTLICGVDKELTASCSLRTFSVWFATGSKFSQSLLLCFLW